MNVWTERGLHLERPSVQLANIDGRDCVAFKKEKGDPITYIFPINQRDSKLVLKLATELFVSPPGTPESIEARTKLLALTTSIEIPPDPSTLSDTPDNPEHRVHVCIVDGL